MTVRVEWLRFTCAFCGSDNTIAKRTDGQVQYGSCHDCGTLYTGESEMNLETINE